MNRTFLTEAIRIGDEVVSKAIRDTHGVFWKTIEIDNKNKMEIGVSEDFNSGMSGIIFFLITLFDVTHQKKYLDISQEAEEWLVWHSRYTKRDHGFLVGRSGVIVPFVKLYQITKNKRYLTYAFHIAKESKNYIQSEFVVNDYYRGSSGMFLF